MTSHPQLEIADREQWRAWLAEHHATSAGVWVVTHKRDSGGPYVPYDDIADEAVAAGWIDSQIRTVDARRSQLLVTPRDPRSRWSRVNKARVARLEAEGLMTPAGRAVVEAAKASGTWTALDAVEALEEPDDLRRALDADPDARREWDAFPRSAKRAILEWILTAKRPATRAKRVTETATLAARGERANQWRQPQRHTDDG